MLQKNVAARPAVLPGVRLIQPPIPAILASASWPAAPTPGVLFTG